MAKNRKNILPILLDLHYKFSMNSFEEFYGNSVSYSEIEQESYIELKAMVFEMIGSRIKFRKFGRDKNILTLKMDITPDEYEIFLRIFKEKDVDKNATNNLEQNPNGILKYKKFNFLHDFTITNIRNLTKAEKIKFKKNVDEYDEIEEQDE